MDTNKNKYSKLTDEEKLLIQYQILSDRRISQNELLWQTPTISFTAQAFLFTIAFGSGIRIEARFVSAFLIIIASVMSIQLMSKHRYLEMKDSKLLEDIEGKLDINKIHKKCCNDDASMLAKIKSYELWRMGMILFLLVALILSAYCFYKMIKTYNIAV